jgi:hypothetical protein
MGDKKLSADAFTEKYLSPENKQGWDNGLEGNTLDPPCSPLCSSLP